MILARSWSHRSRTVTVGCENCIPGQFAEYNASSSDLSKTGVSGEAFCADCPSGRYSGWKASSCLLCPVGKITQSSGSYECEACSPGFYQSSTGATSCDVCAMNRFSSQASESMCESCPLQSITLSVGSSSIHGCVCPRLFYGKPWINGKCYSCLGLPGSDCLLNSSVPSVKAGYFRREVSIHEVTIDVCFPSSACLASYKEDNLCANGYEGLRCGICSLGRSRVGSFCKPCNNRAVSALLTIGVFIFTASWIIFRLVSHRISSKAQGSVLLFWLQINPMFSRLSASWSSELEWLFQGLNLLVKFFSCVLC